VPPEPRWRSEHRVIIIHGVGHGDEFLIGSVNRSASVPSRPSSPMMALAANAQAAWRISHLPQTMHDPRRACQ
jgi:hypothetical protein